MDSQIEHEKGLLSYVDSPFKAELKENLKTHHDIYNGRDQFAVAVCHWRLSDVDRQIEECLRNWGGTK